MINSGKQMNSNFKKLLILHEAQKVSELHCTGDELN